MCVRGDAACALGFLGSRPAALSRPPDKKVFPKFDVVGWYSTGAELQDADLELQRTVRADAPSPAFSCR